MVAQRGMMSQPCRPMSGGGIERCAVEAAKKTLRRLLGPKLFDSPASIEVFTFRQRHQGHQRHHIHRRRPTGRNPISLLAPAVAIQLPHHAHVPHVLFVAPIIHPV